MSEVRKRRELGGPTLKTLKSSFSLRRNFLKIDIFFPRIACLFGSRILIVLGRALALTRHSKVRPRHVPTLKNDISVATVLMPFKRTPGSRTFRASSGIVMTDRSKKGKPGQNAAQPGTVGSSPDKTTKSSHSINTSTCITFGKSTSINALD